MGTVHAPAAVPAVSVTHTEGKNFPQPPPSHVLAAFAAARAALSQGQDVLLIIIAPSHKANTHYIHTMLDYEYHYHNYLLPPRIEAFAYAATAFIGGLFNDLISCCRNTKSCVEITRLFPVYQTGI